MRCENLDTVLGLSITPTTLGWVLAEGHGADGAILDRNELELHSGRNAQAIHNIPQSSWRRKFCSPMKWPLQAIIGCASSE